MLAPATGSADDDPTPVGGRDRVAERCAVDDCGELELVAAGHEDAGHVVEQADEGRVVGVLAALRACGEDVLRPEPAEEGVVHLDDLGTERGRGGDDRDLGVRAAGETRTWRARHGGRACPPRLRSPSGALVRFGGSVENMRFRWRMGRSACSAAYGVSQLTS